MRVLIAGVGYSFLRDLSVGPVLVPELRRLDWPAGWRSTTGASARSRLSSVWRSGRASTTGSSSSRRWNGGGSRGGCHVTVGQANCRSGGDPAARGGGGDGGHQPRQPADHRPALRRLPAGRGGGRGRAWRIPTGAPTSRRAWRRRSGRPSPRSAVRRWTGSMADPLDAIRRRDELLQVLYWFRGEGLGESVAPHDLVTFLGSEPESVRWQLEGLVDEGYVVAVDGDAGALPADGVGGEGGREALRRRVCRAHGTSPRRVQQPELLLPNPRTGSL